MVTDAKYVGRLMKTSLWIQKEISLQIYFFGIVYFFRYVKISSTLENNCAYTVDRCVLWWPRLFFSFVSFSSYAGILMFFSSTSLSTFSFQLKIFRYHKPVIFPDEVIFPVILFESSIFSRFGQILNMKSFLFQYFSFFEQFSFFQNSNLTTTISCLI